MTTHSFTGFETFDVCPYKFYKLRVEKSVKEEDNEHSLAGKRDHLAFEERLKYGTALPAHLAKHEGLCQALVSSPGELKAEQELAITADFKPTGWWDNDVWFRAKADVTIANGDNAVVLDWKTGKRKPKPFQLELGAMMEMIHNPDVKNVRAAFVWLKEDTTDPENYTRENDFERIKSKVIRKADKIEEAKAEDVWRTKPGYHCNWCPAKNVCPDSQAR